ncbi:hypothetical protein I553_6958 [Mycobacterium xenopi 4042]|uniref:Uncharacterized protein n=1 Tax=Mycobacterium xenopi 4042 TaxID=1299334 RepID=X7Z3D3_MYCXE|nr:hypothetical protein I553_6958 [Mycobacterium xenopi 4042]
MQLALAEPQRFPVLDDLRDDRGVRRIVDAAEQLIGHGPAPIAVVSDKRALLL